MNITGLLDSIFFVLSNIVVCYMVYRFLIPRKSAIFMKILIPCIAGIIFYFFAYSKAMASLIPNISIRQKFITCTILISYILYITLLFKSQIREKVIALIGVVTSIFLSELTMVIIVLPLNITSVNARDLTLSTKLFIDVLTLLVYTFYICLAYYFLNGKIVNLPWQILLYIACIVISIFFITFIIVDVTSESADYLKLAIVMAICFSGIILKSVYEILKYLSGQLIFNEKVNMTKEMQKEDLSYYKNIHDKTEEIRKIQHDYKDTLQTLKLLILNESSESKEKELEIIDDLTNKIDVSKIKFYTNNIVINATLTSKINEAENLGINVITTIDLPDIIKSIDYLDINLIIVNLFNNAIDACKMLSPNDNKSIEFRMAVKGNFLFIKTINTFSKVKYDDNGHLITSKKDKKNHGIGLQIIKDIVKKYNGSDSISTENNKFTHAVNLETEIK